MKVVVGLSGGVDSSVAALLLREQGYDVTGLYMINWHDTTGTLEGDCPWKDDLIFAQLVCKKLDIPFHQVDLSKEYKKRIIDYMFREYREGRTPNPDVLCNREVKFDLFLKEALKLGADYIATGHYCRKESMDWNGKSLYRLMAGKDPNKEQSYFLCQVNQQQLEKALFPVGEMHKEEVRKIAAGAGLATAERKDSQGICFIGKVDLPTFLQQKLEPKKGDIIQIPAGHPEYKRDRKGIKELSAPYRYQPDEGILMGQHQGAHFYTVGQRKGMNVGGRKEPLFVLDTDTEKNVVYVGEGKDHPGLYRKGLFVPAHEIHWIRPDLAMKSGEHTPYLVRIRYRQPLQPAVLYREKEGLYILFDKKQRGIARGQFAAWYRDDELTGSGVIA